MTNESPACGRCGSTALHHKVHGMPTPELFEEAERRPDLTLAGCCVMESDWTTECVTCGQRKLFGRSADSEWTTVTRPDTAGLISAYAASTRQRLGTAQTQAISYLGLWLLLARFAPVASGAHRERLAEVLGVSCDEAAALAAGLLDAPHPTVAAALGAWSRSPATATLPVSLDELPDQAGLDRWASEHTRGLIERFPLQVDPLTELVLATALVLQPRWTTELGTDDNGRLVLEDGLQTIVDTSAAGLVAVAKPFSEDGVDVVSVIAAAMFRPPMYGEVSTRSSPSSTRAHCGTVNRLAGFPSTGTRGPSARQPRDSLSGTNLTTTTTSGAVICRAGRFPWTTH